MVEGTVSCQIANVGLENGRHINSENILLFD